MEDERASTCNRDARPRFIEDPEYTKKKHKQKAKALLESILIISVSIFILSVGFKGIKAFISTSTHEEMSEYAEMLILIILFVQIPISSIRMCIKRLRCL